jgi:hypothetical protein
MNTRQCNHINFALGMHKFQSEIIAERLVRYDCFLSALDKLIIFVVEDLIIKNRNVLEAPLAISELYFVNRDDGKKFHFFWFMFGKANLLFIGDSIEVVQDDYNWIHALLEDVSRYGGEPIIQNGSDLFIPRIKEHGG